MFDAQETNNTWDLLLSEDGSSTLLSNNYGVTYHSRHGALQESEHVFIKSGLDFIKEDKNEIHIFEMGFGTGLNAYLSLLYALRNNLNIQYTSFELHPLPRDLVKQLNYTELLPEHANLFQLIHDIDWNKMQKLHPNFSINKVERNILDFSYEETFDVIFYDAFAPETQGKLWEAPIMEKMYQSLKNDGVLVTYCAKGVFKRTLKAIGFEVQSIPGPPGKREMTRAVRNA
jgi:tRNA U34 5-methylaminomethyl-2-thiouridine-forming methyltransferase MnmC